MLLLRTYLHPPTIHLIMTDNNHHYVPEVEGYHQLLNIDNTNMIKIATNNVCGLNDQTKQANIMTYIETQKIDIMGLSETKMFSNAADSLYRNESSYRI